MSWFITIYILVYSTFHFFMYLRLVPVFPAGLAAKLTFWGWSALMVAGPALCRMLSYNGQVEAAQAMAWVSYIWMGFVLFFLACSLGMWLVQGLFALAARFTAWHPGGWARPQVYAWVILVLAVTMSLAAFYEARGLEVTRLVIRTDKFPQGAAPMKIIQTGDLHLGLTSRVSRLEEAARIIAREKPDLLVDTGDMVDGFLKDGALEKAILKSLKAPLGKYAVLGNHEYISGTKHSLAFMRSAGYRVLRAESLNLTPYFLLSGIDYPRGGAGREKAPEPPEGAFSVLLSHHPGKAVEAKGYDLRLAGHTHGGQFFPYLFFVRMFHKYFKGEYSLKDGGKVYVSRGTGTWGPPMRLFAPPELTIFEIRPR